MMTKIDDVDVTLAIFDGRVAMNAEGEADCYIETPAVDPLSASEPHATLRVADNGYRAEITLDADDVDALQAALAGEKGDQ